MKLLVAVTSYFPDAERGCHQAIREGWGKDVTSAGADLLFFTPYPHFPASLDLCSYIGGNVWKRRDYIAQPDEVWLQMNGIYNNMTQQVQNIMKWSLERNYDFVHLCANDTFTVPKKLFASGFEQWDWRGDWYPKISALPGETFDWKWYETTIPQIYGWISGCGGMTLSKKAMKIFADVDVVSWVAKYDFCGFGYDFVMAQVFGPLFKTRELLVRDEVNFLHYQHSPNEQRYAGVVAWQKKMYKENQ